MADLTKIALRNRVLEHLGVLDAGGTAATNDQTLVDEAVDAAYARLRKFGLAPFAINAIPPWAQMQMRDIVAADVAQVYGMSGTRLAEFKETGREAEQGLVRQIAGSRPPLPIKATYF